MLFKNSQQAVIPQPDSVLYVQRTEQILRAQFIQLLYTITETEQGHGVT